MRRPLAVIVALAACLAAETAVAEPLRVGVAAPLTGASDILGRQIVAGATAAAPDAELEVVDDACTSDGGSAAARRFVAAGVRAVIGFLCAESIEAALPILEDAGIPVITPGVRVDRLTDRRQRTGWFVYRLAPRDDAQGQAVATLIPRLWRNHLFAIVDDGTIYGRELAETLRAAAEQQALKPVFIDTFRPQMDNQIGLVGRLRNAGASRVFVGGDHDDLAIMGRDAKAMEADIVLAGGEALRAAPGALPLADGTLMVGLPEWADIAAPAVLATLAERKVIPEGYVLPAYAAMQIALAATGLPAAPGTRPEVLFAGPFDTAIGSIRFDAKGDLAENPYRVFRVENGRFTVLESQ